MVRQVLVGSLVSLALSTGCTPETKTPEAMVDLEQVRQASGQGIADLDKAIRSEPREAGLYKLRGRLLLEQKSYPAALGDFEEAIKLKPGLGEPYYLRARAQRAIGQTSEALASVKQALALGYENADVYVLAGEIELALQDEKEALGHLNEALRRNPDHPYAFHYKGLALAAAGDTAKALQHLQRALREDRAFTPTYTALARLHQARKAFDLAHRFLRQALVLEPQNGLLWYLTGLAYEGLALPDSAFRSYSQASLLDPGLEEQVVLRQARIAYGQKDFGTAIQYLLPVLADDQNHDAVRWMLAESYEKNGQLKEALNHYLVLKDKNPADRKAYLSYWQLHQRLYMARPAVERTLIPLIENKSSLIRN